MAKNSISGGLTDQYTNLKNLCQSTLASVTSLRKFKCYDSIDDPEELDMHLMSDQELELFELVIIDDDPVRLLEINGPEKTVAYFNPATGMIYKIDFDRITNPTEIIYLIEFVESKIS